jgi:cytochrome c-type biogenesis protein CcmH/NrfG
LGNAFEQLGRPEDALEAYRESHALYPELPAVKTRLEQLEAEIEGDVL